jgi:hypothetical protein
MMSGEKSLVILKGPLPKSEWAAYRWTIGLNTTYRKTIKLFRRVVEIEGEDTKSY